MRIFGQTHLFHKYLVSIYFVSGSIGTERNTAVTRHYQISAHMDLWSTWMGEGQGSKFIAKMPKN